MNEHNRYKPENTKAVEERKVQSVVSGVAKVKKKRELGKVASMFISEDAKNVGEYVMERIVVPTVKKGLIGAIEMIFNGDTSSDKRQLGAHRVSYRDYYDEPRGSRFDRGSSPATRFSAEDIEFDTRGDAEVVLAAMRSEIRQYDFVSLGAMYDLCDLTPPAYTCYDFGWYSLNTADVVRVRDKYIIRLPKMTPRD